MHFLSLPKYGQLNAASIDAGCSGLNAIGNICEKQKETVVEFSLHLSKQ